MERHYGQIQNGRLKAASLVAIMKSEEEGTVFEFTIRKAGRRKTQDQNSYLHVLFTIAANEMNKSGFGDGQPWTKERVKMYAKQAGLYPIIEMVKPGGEIIQLAKDTRELDKDDARETIDRVLMHFADEFGIYLPEPGQQVDMDLAA